MTNSQLICFTLFLIILFGNLFYFLVMEFLEKENFDNPFYISGLIIYVFIKLILIFIFFGICVVISMMILDECSNWLNSYPPLIKLL